MPVIDEMLVGVMVVVVLMSTNSQAVGLVQAGHGEP